MKIAIKAGAAVAALLLWGSAAALEVLVDNQTKTGMALCFSYLSDKQQDWIVEGWFNVPSGTTARVNLETANEIYYLFAEFGNGKTIEGGEGAVNLGIDNTSFSYLQSKPPAQLARTVSFLRARSNGDRAVIRVK